MTVICWDPGFREAVDHRSPGTRERLVSKGQ
jgi:hypothetical protein